MKKIMFNDKYGLTKAVVEGRKTQTRRICKEQVWAHSDIVNAENGIFHFEIPKYKVGEVVAVAQSYGDIVDELENCNNTTRVVHYEKIGQKASEYMKLWMELGFYNKLFVASGKMIHQIRITNVRVEKLEDISEQDAIAEGITYVGLTYDDYGEPMYIIDGCKKEFSSARDAYAWLINKISGKGTWLSNPYVFVYDFELVK